jgi:hypothetical protein
LRLQKGQIGWHILGFGGPSTQDKPADLFSMPCNLMQEARLANPWFARHQGDMEATGNGLLKLTPEGSKFALPSYQHSFKPGYFLDDDSSS